MMEKEKEPEQDMIGPKKPSLEPLGHFIFSFMHIGCLLLKMTNLSTNLLTNNKLFNYPTVACATISILNCSVKKL